MPTTALSVRGKVPPAPPAFPILGHLPRLARGEAGCLYDALRKLAAEYGPVVKLTVPGRTWYLVSDTDLAREVLIRNAAAFPKGDTLTELKVLGLGAQGLMEADGVQWERQRRLLQPLFKPSQIDAMLPVMNDAARRTTALIEAREETEFLDLMMRYALAVACEVVFGARLTCLDGVAHEDPLLVRQHYVSEQLMIRVQRTRLWRHLPLPSNFRVRRMIRQQIAYFDEVIEDHRRHPGKYSDILSLLLTTRDENGAELTQQELRDQLQNLMGAAHESVGASAHWMFYEIAQRPELDAALHAEVTRALPDGAEVTAEAVERMPALVATVSETLRTRPTFPIIPRQVAKDCTLGGFALEGGAWAIVLTGSILNDKTVWGQDACEFDPRRFQQGELPARCRAANVPFGLGPRVCIGKQMAEREMAVIGAHLLRRFRFEVAPGQNVRPYLRFALMSKSGIRLRRVRR